MANAGLRAAIATAATVHRVRAATAGATVMAAAAAATATAAAAALTGRARAALAAVAAVTRYGAFHDKLWFYLSGHLVLVGFLRRLSRGGTCLCALQQ